MPQTGCRQPDGEIGSSRIPVSCREKRQHTRRQSIKATAGETPQVLATASHGANDCRIGSTQRPQGPLKDIARRRAEMPGDCEFQSHQEEREHLRHPRRYPLPKLIRPRLRYQRWPARQHPHPPSRQRRRPRQLPRRWPRPPGRWSLPSPRRRRARPTRKRQPSRRRRTLKSRRRRRRLRRAPPRSSSAWWWGVGTRQPRCGGGVGRQRCGSRCDRRWRRCADIIGASFGLPYAEPLTFRRACRGGPSGVWACPSRTHRPGRFLRCQCSQTHQPEL